MGQYHFMNNPSMGLKKFMGLQGVAREKILDTKPGKVKLSNGVVMLAKTLSGTILAGEEIEVIGIDNTKLIVEASDSNDDHSHVAGDLSDKINALSNSLEIKKIMDRIDDYIANEEGDKAEIEIERLEKLTLTPEEFMNRIEERAMKFEEEGDLKNALVYYKKLKALKRNSK